MILLVSHEILFELIKNKIKKNHINAIKITWDWSVCAVITAYTLPLYWNSHAIKMKFSFTPFPEAKFPNYFKYFVSDTIHCLVIPKRVHESMYDKLIPNQKFISSRLPSISSSTSASRPIWRTAKSQVSSSPARKLNTENIFYFMLAHENGKFYAR